MDRAQMLLRAEHTPAETDVDWAFRRYAPYVAAIGMRLLGRDDEVDDLVQEVFCDALRGIAGLRDPEAVRGWLATVTVRKARRRLRWRRVRATLGLDAAVSYEHVAGSDADPEQRALLAQLYAALDRMGTDLRLAWTLRHIEGEQLDAVAALCGCSLATAKRRIAAAHALLTRAVDHG